MKVISVINITKDKNPKKNFYEGLYYKFSKRQSNTKLLKWKRTYENISKIDIYV